MTNQHIHFALLLARITMTLAETVPLPWFSLARALDQQISFYLEGKFHHYLTNVVCY